MGREREREESKLSQRDRDSAAAAVAPGSGGKRASDASQRAQQHQHRPLPPAATPRHEGKKKKTLTRPFCCRFVTCPHTHTQSGGSDYYFCITSARVSVRLCACADIINVSSSPFGAFGGKNPSSITKWYFRPSNKKKHMLGVFVVVWVTRTHTHKPPLSLLLHILLAKLAPPHAFHFDHCFGRGRHSFV